MSQTKDGATRSFLTRNDLDADTRHLSISRLNESLAQAFDLMSQTKQAHWNVKGEQFYSLHLLFDKLAEELSGFVDDIAERVTALGGYAQGTVRMSARHSSLTEYPVEATTGREHVEALVERFGDFAAHLREAIDATADAGDASTSDLYTEISRAIDKDLWFLEAHIQDRERL